MEFVLGSESSTDQHQPSSGSQLHSTVTFPSSIHSPPPFECKQTKKLNSFSSFCTVGCFMPRFEHGHEAKKKANPLHRQQSLLNAQFGKLKVTELSRWLIICASATQRDSASCRCFQRMLCYNWAPASRKEGFPPPPVIDLNRSNKNDTFLHDEGKGAHFCHPFGDQSTGPGAIF